MGFRFSNLSPIYKFYISRISLNSYANQSRFVLPFLQFATQFQHHYVLFPDNPHYTITRRWHVSHSHHHLNSSEEADKVFKLGLAADVALAAGKGITGYLSGSTAIIADAAHSVSDIVLSGVALWSFRVARTPKDKEHPYGHGKFETLGALGISCMLLATAGGIAWHTVDILMTLFSSSPEIANHSWSHQHVNSHVHGGHHHGIDVHHPFLALSMTIVSIAVKEGLFWITKRAGEREGSGLMKANAWHHRADAISSVVALIGVGGSILGIKFLDPFAGLVVSGMILKAGLENGYQSVMELVDAGVPSALLDPIRQTILGVEGVEGCHHLRGRKAGSSMYLDIHIEVDPFLSVSAAHDIGENVRHQIHKFHNEVAEVFIHIDPAISKYAPSIVDRQDALRGPDLRTTDTCSEKNGVESIVSDIFLSKFPEKMIVEHSTRHLLEGKIFLQVEVSMPPDMLIRDAMEFAKNAEEEIFKAAPCVKQVSILLRLGHPVPQFRH